MYYGWFGAVARAMVGLLHFFYGIVGNYGIAIIMLTVLVRGLHVPAQPRPGQEHGEDASCCKPEMDRIKEKYKGDQQKQAQAMQELYRKHNVNPLGGCLPMFIQLPVFIGLYRGLAVDVELRRRRCSARHSLVLEPGGARHAVRLVGLHAATSSSRRRSWPGPVPERAAAGHDRAVPAAAEDVHAAADRRAGGDAAEDHEVHDDLHGLHVLQSAQRAVHVLHRLEPVGHRRAEADCRRRRPISTPTGGGHVDWRAVEAAASADAAGEKRYGKNGAAGGKPKRRSQASLIVASLPRRVRRDAARRGWTSGLRSRRRHGLHVNDTIVAVASAPGGAARGVVRLSGPQTLCVRWRVASRRDGDEPSIARFRTRRGDSRTRFDIASARANSAPMIVPGDLFLWPATRSYTRQPAAEFHTIGSPPLLAAVVEQLGRPAPTRRARRVHAAGVSRRPDRPDPGRSGAGRHRRPRRDELDAALDQLAGGLSRPLHRLRDELLDVLAELEAGLDFADEDIEFISRDALRGRLVEAQAVVAATLAQLAARDRRDRSAARGLVGPAQRRQEQPVQRAGRALRRAAPPRPSCRRNPAQRATILSARVELDGVACELVDTAGDDAERPTRFMQAAQAIDGPAAATADLRLRCVDATRRTPAVRDVLLDAGHGRCRRADEDAIWLGAWSTATAPMHRRRLQALPARGSIDLAADALAATRRGRRTTAQRSPPRRRRAARGSLREAQRACGRDRIGRRGADELFAAEIRAALDALGEVVGAVCTDDVLDRVFSQFCIGK